jgi:antitoxin (DNA-binding transcriptional repressor) of toxin-antitoxin stability system
MNVGVYEAKKHLPELLAKVEQGVQITLPAIAGPLPVLCR